VSTVRAAPILTLSRAAGRVEALRRRAGSRPRVVLANGLFDLLHVGHLRYLGASRRLGDVLIVALNDDRSARRLRGAGRPLVPARDRARLVAGVRGVELVVLFGGRTVATVLRRLRPEVHCKGTDYTPGTVPERNVVRSYGGLVRIAGDPKRHASTDLIRRIGGVRRRRVASPG
jgi:rfaE bifunctional protein nucleotidyltransferase chain/domain